MSFRGSLNDVPLPDIIQLVSASGKTGAFVLRSASKAGEIYLREGQIVHAHVGPVTGEDAVYEIATWLEGDFSFQVDQRTREHTIDKSNTRLLMAAAQRIDEWAVLSKHVPSTRLIPRLTDQSWSTSISFSPQEWSVICKIDKRRSIEEIAATLGHSAFEVCKLLYGLVTTGLVELKESRGPDPADRLRQMSRSELALTARRIYEHAASLLAGHDSFGKVETICGHAMSQIQGGHGVDAVVAMIQSVEEVLTTALGPVKARVFADKVEQTLA